MHPTHAAPELTDDHGGVGCHGHILYFEIALLMQPRGAAWLKVTPLEDKIYQECKAMQATKYHNDACWGLPLSSANFRKRIALHQRIFQVCTALLVAVLLKSFVNRGVVRASGRHVRRTLNTHIMPSTQRQQSISCPCSPGMSHWRPMQCYVGPPSFKAETDEPSHHSIIILYSL